MYSILPACIFVYIFAWYPQGFKEGIKQTPGIGITDAFELSSVFWEPSLHPLQEQQVLQPLVLTLHLAAAVVAAAAAAAAPRKTKHVLVYTTVSSAFLGSLSQPNHVCTKHV